MALYYLVLVARPVLDFLWVPLVSESSKLQVHLSILIYYATGRTFESDPDQDKSLQRLHILPNYDVHRLSCMKNLTITNGWKSGMPLVAPNVALKYWSPSIASIPWKTCTNIAKRKTCIQLVGGIGASASLDYFYFQYLGNYRYAFVTMLLLHT